MRILGDSAAYAGKSEALLRQALTKAGIEVPMTIDLELNKYLDGRGDKKLNFQKEAEFQDPFGQQDRFLMIKFTK
jgi:nitrite reductase (cytochrome c-552)